MIPHSILLGFGFMASGAAPADMSSMTLLLRNAATRIRRAGR